MTNAKLINIHKGEIKVNELIYTAFKKSGFSIKEQIMINNKYLRNLYQIELV